MIMATVDLTKLRYVEVEQREMNGQKTECLVIPIKENGFLRSKGGRIFMNLAIKDMRMNKMGFSHYISVYNKDKEWIEDVKNSGFSKDLMFIGHCKTFRFLNKENGKEVTPLDVAMDTE